MNLVSSVVNNWLEKIKLKKKWARQKYGKFTHRFYQDPKFLVVEAGLLGGAGYFFLRPGEPVLDGPPELPPPPDVGK